MSEQPKIQLRWKEHFPLREFFPAPKILHSGADKIYVEDDVDHAVYLAELVVGQLMDFDYAPELCLPLVDAYYLTDNGHFVGYYFKPKARNVVIAGTHVVVSTNAYRKAVSTDTKPKSDIQYTTEHLSAFSSLAGSCMLLRQFNSPDFIDKLSS